MKLLLLLTSLVMSISHLAHGGASDDPLVVKTMIDQFETRNGSDETPLVFEGYLWAGYDLNKFWLKMDTERVDGETEELELQALFSKAISPYWDIQVGLRRDFQPEESDLDDQNWAVIGLYGLAPYFFEMDNAVSISESGQVALEFAIEYELMLTQKLLLSPELEATFYGKDDDETGLRSGLAEVEVGLRMHYEIRRELSPYLGIHRSQKFGKTADQLRSVDVETTETVPIVGIRAWF